MLSIGRSTSRGNRASVLTWSSSGFDDDRLLHGRPLHSRPRSMSETAILRQRDLVRISCFRVHLPQTELSKDQTVPDVSLPLGRAGALEVKV
jgi:hypothetical protein